MKILKKEYIDINIEAKSIDSLFDVVADNFEKNSVVKKSYREALKKRETTFPTGLITEKYGVAIPHTDIEHANENAIGFYRLVEPLSFGIMGEEDLRTDVVLVFPLVVKDANDYMIILRNMMNLLQNTSLLEDLHKSKNNDEVLTILENVLEKENIYE